MECVEIVITSTSLHGAVELRCKSSSGTFYQTSCDYQNMNMCVIVPVCKTGDEM